MQNCSRDGAPLFDPDGRRVGASCGVTFVSPSFVLAADCSGGALRLPEASTVSGFASALLIENLGAEEVLIDRLSVAFPAGAADTGDPGAQQDACTDARG